MMKYLMFISILFTLFLNTSVWAEEALTPKDLLSMKSVLEAKMSPKGEWIAYTVNVPRKVDDDPGESYRELYLLSTKTGKSNPCLTGKVTVRSMAWHPKGSNIGFIRQKDSDTLKQVWVLPVEGGEEKKLTNSQTSVRSFKWHPSGEKLAYIAESPKTEKEKFLKNKGYNFNFQDEDWKHRNLYMIDLNELVPTGKIDQLTKDVTVWSFTFSPDGNKIAAAVSEKNLVDYRYMFQKIYLINPESKTLTKLSNNPGKLGNFVFSPDGKKIAYTAAQTREDHAVSQVYILPIGGGKETNLTIPKFKGHVNWVDWKDNNTLIYRSAEGVGTTLSTVKSTGGNRKVIYSSKDTGIIIKSIHSTDNYNSGTIIGDSPTFPTEVFQWFGGKKIKRATNVNPWLKERILGEQEARQYNSRDGHQIEGILLRPVGWEKGKLYPLVVIVHGGPESNYSNGWMTSYSRPGQVLAGKGYFVFYPNYRSSTGYGIEYAMKWHLKNPAGTEFDDIADGIDHLVQVGLVDRDRVGLGGGSYGGFASAWFASYYTKYVKAVCMFVGIGNLISKRGTTDIPYEMRYVHYGMELEDYWDLHLKRSPIYYAHQSRTAVLIYGGKDDTRVDPSQSLEFYTRLKMNNHPAVRLVQYPGEGHGNKKQPGRIDVLYRILDWYDWYVKDAKPLEGPMPPLDISDKYGLDLPE
jgi:dipeptidyl aminopeptidase/acylaminoacyl peptidase